MPWSVINSKTKTVEDVTCQVWKHPSFGSAYNVTLGRRSIGQVHAGRGSGWTAISSAVGADLVGLSRVEGFKRRADAIEYLLRVGSLYE